MNQEKFNEIWQAADSFITDLKDIDSRVYLAPQSKKNIFDAYHQIKSDYKVATAKEHDQIFDRHKIASLFIKAVLKEKPLKIQEHHEGATHNKVRLRNELFAIDCAFIILWSYLYSDLKKEGEEELAETVLAGGIQFPACHHGISFKLHLAKALYHTEWNRSPDKFSMLFLANIFFQLENHNLTYYRLINSGYS